MFIVVSLFRVRYFTLSIAARTIIAIMLLLGERRLGEDERPLVGYFVFSYSTWVVDLALCG